MKCDELKDYSILDIEAIDEERFKKESAPGKWVPESRVHLKSDVDAAIDELKAAHHKERHEYIKMVEELKAEINRKEAVEQRWFERCMEARTENIRLKRALYKACANWAFLAQWERGELVENWEKWENVERKCRAKKGGVQIMHLPSIIVGITIGWAVTIFIFGIVSICQ